MTELSTYRLMSNNAHSDTMDQNVFNISNTRDQMTKPTLELYSICWYCLDMQKFRIQLKQLEKI